MPEMYRLSDAPVHRPNMFYIERLPFANASGSQFVVFVKFGQFFGGLLVAAEVEAEFTHHGKKSREEGGKQQ